MSAINLKSITGITSITTPAGVDNQLTLHTNDTTQRVKVTQSGIEIVGVSTFQDIDVDGHTNLDNVSIAGVSTLGSGASGQVRLDYQGNQRLKTHTWGVEVSGALSANNIVATAANSSFAGASFTGAIDANGDLDVDGHTNLDNVSIAGVSTFTGQARFNGELVGSTISVLSGYSINIPDKLIHSGDTDTAIRFPSADNISFETGGSERLRVSNSLVTVQNSTLFASKITNSSSYTSHNANFYGGDVNTGGVRIELAHTTTTVSGNTASGAFPHNLLLSNYSGSGSADNRMVSIGFDIPTTGSHANATIAYQATASNGTGDLQFWLENGNTSYERLRITSAGQTLIKGFNGTGLKLEGSGSDYQGIQIVTTDSSTSQTRNIFIDAVNETGAAVANQVGSVLSNGGSEWSWSTQPSGDRTARRVERLRINSSGQLIMTNAATQTFADFSTTNNNTRGLIKLDGKDSSGNAVSLRMGGFGDTNRGEIFTQSNHGLGFATNNAATQMMLDTGGDLLLGATSFSGFAGADRRFLINGSSNARFEFGVGGNQIGGLYADADKVVLYTSNNDYLSLQTVGNEKLKIDNSAIYVKSGFPLAFLASSGATPNIKSGGTNNQDLLFTSGSGNPTRMRVTSGGTVQIEQNIRLESKPNGSWGAGLYFGGNGNAASSTHGSMVVTNGNIHIDARNGGYGTYLNWYSGGGGTYFGNANGNQAGRIDSSGNLSLSGSYPGSDLRLKENIQNISGATDTIKSLSGKTFTWKTEAGLDDWKHYGFIAQEVQKVTPDLVKDIGCHYFDKDDKLVTDIDPTESDEDRKNKGITQSLTINTEGVTPILVEAMKELIAKVETLEAEVSALKSS